MITSEKVYFSSFWTSGKSDFSESDHFRCRAIEKGHFLKSDHFHGFAFSDRRESISDLRKIISGEIFPRNTFPETFLGNSSNRFCRAIPLYVILLAWQKNLIFVAVINSLNRP